MDAPRHRTDTRPRGGNRIAPWRTREDNAILAQLDAAQARAFENLLHQQARSDQKFLVHNPVSLEGLAEARPL